MSTRRSAKLTEVAAESTSPSLGVEAIIDPVN